VVDSDFRFFPTMRDDVFGYVLHPVDLAMNKVMAAAGRRELGDLVDVLLECRRRRESFAALSHLAARTSGDTALASTECPA
jgi:hypothetical protein